MKLYGYIEDSVFEKYSNIFYDQKGLFLLENNIIKEIKTNRTATLQDKNDFISFSLDGVKPFSQEWAKVMEQADKCINNILRDTFFAVEGYHPDKEHGKTDENFGELFAFEIYYKDTYSDSGGTKIEEYSSRQNNIQLSINDLLNNTTVFIKHFKLLDNNMIQKREELYKFLLDENQQHSEESVHYIKTISDAKKFINYLLEHENNNNSLSETYTQMKVLLDALPEAIPGYPERTKIDALISSESLNIESLEDSSQQLAKEARKIESTNKLLQTTL